MAEMAAAAPQAVLLRARDGYILHQAIYAVAKLSIADHLAAGEQSVQALADAARVNQGALYRVLRLLAGEGIFAETADGGFRNTDSSELLRAGVPGSLRPNYLYWGSEFGYPSFGEILYCVETGEPATAKLFGMDGFAYLRQRPELARVFDDAMTATVQSIAPAIAAAYDFGAWESLMDVGGGTGILLATILRAHSTLRGVLADQQHVLERANQREYLSGDLEPRVSMQPCDFFAAIPPGCRACMMSRVIHDWTDEQATVILSNCRKAVPADGVLLLIENALSASNQPSPGKYVDVIMLALTGGREREVEEYRALLRGSGFRLHRVIPTATNYSIFEALPI